MEKNFTKFYVTNWEGRVGSDPNKNDVTLFTLFFELFPNEYYQGLNGKVRNSACVDRQVYNLSFLQKSSLVTAYLLNLLQTSVLSFLL